MEMPRTSTPAFGESTLSKGQIRKLNALRKSLGNEIADKAFAEWLSTVGTEGSEAGDRHAEMIAELLTPLALEGKLKIPRGGYIVRRGHGRVIVERPS